ncbi:N-carbamoyl-D-amino acid hydrolase [Pelomyxa schiedti]|nr:N-carbamoyl-D-amino acid hydrolase [Pelomyxa schiedti]
MSAETTQVVPVEPGSSVKVACVQESSDLQATDHNCDKFEAQVRIAAANGAKIVVLPEMCLTGYLSQDLKKSWHVPGKPLNRSPTTNSTFEGVDPTEFAEPVPGKTTNRFCALARELQIYLTIPFCEKVVPPPLSTAKFLFYNTVVVANPAGTICAHYRKNNLWPYIDLAWQSRGTENVCFETEYGKVALAVCFDIHIMFERYSNVGDVWALLYSIAWVDTDTRYWFTYGLPEFIQQHPPAKYVLGANWSIDKPESGEGWNGYGYSSIYGPSGVLLAQAKTQIGPEIVYADIPVDKHP